MYNLAPIAQVAAAHGSNGDVGLFAWLQVAWSSSGGNSFLGSSMAQPSDFSMKTADEVDGEVKQLVERAYRWGSRAAVAAGDSVKWRSGSRLEN